MNLKILNQIINYHPSQRVTHSYNLIARPTQSSSSSRTRLASSSISALLSHRAQPQSSASENLPSLSDIPLSIRPSCGRERSFTVQSYPKSTYLFGDQESASSLSATNSVELPNQSLDENSRPPTADTSQYLLILDNQIFNLPRQGVSYHVLPVKRRNNSLHYSKREQNRLIQPAIKLEFEVTVKFVGLNLHPTPTSTQIKHRNFPRPFLVTNLQFSFSDERPFDPQCDV